MFADVIYAARTLRRNPSFSAVVILTLTLGIGANTAIFSVVNGVLLKPLAYEAPERQVRLKASVESPSGAPELRPLNLTADETRELARRSRAFEHVGAIGRALNLWPGREPRWTGGQVTASIFPMLGVRPVLGRFFVPNDEVEGAPGVIVLSYGAWLRHFGGAADVIGRTIALEPVLGRPVRKDYSVIGVAPEGFDYLPGSAWQYWIPMPPTGAGTVVARLAPAVSTATATREIEPMARELQGRRPGLRTFGYAVVDMREDLVGPIKPALLLLMGAVGFVLLIACVNVAHLMLVRSLARRREIAIRRAIGAGPGRILRLMLAESLILTIVAAASGIALATAGVGILRRLAMTAGRADLGQIGAGVIPRLDDVRVDGWALTFTLAVAAGAGLLFGLVGANERHRTGLPAALGSAPGAGAGARFRGPSIRRLLVVAEVALSIVLLVGGGLLVASFIRLVRVDVGYDPSRVLTFQIALPSERYPLLRVRDFAEDFVTRLPSAPGIRSAAYANQLPLVQLRDTLSLGRTPDARRRPPASGGDVRIVSRGYFATMRIPVLGGRVFDDRDGDGQPRVMVINEALARRDFGSGANALGSLLYVGNDPAPWTIIGVVADVRQLGLNRPGDPQFFLDARQWGRTLSPLFPLSPYYTVRFERDGTAAIAAVRSALARAESEGVLFNVAPMADIVSGSVARPRLYASLLGLFAAVGVTMALVGIYGVMSYTVSERTRELGIRLALGARPSSVVALVLRESVMLTAAGIVLGLLGAAALARTLGTLLFELAPLDPMTFTAVPLLFVLCAGLAAALPARRATRVDPIQALKTE